MSSFETLVTLTSRNSYSQRVTVNSFWAPDGSAMKSAILCLCGALFLVCFFFIIYSVTFLIHSLCPYLPFNSFFSPMCGGEVNGISSLHFLQDDAKSVRSGGRSINSTRTHPLFLLLLHKMSCFFILRLNGLCLASCALSQSLDDSFE